MRYIKNYKPETITPEFIDSQDWDLIELPWTIDAEKLENWYNEVDKKYNIYTLVFDENSI